MGTYGNYTAEITFRSEALADLFALGIRANKSKKMWELESHEGDKVEIYCDGKMFDFTTLDPNDTEFWDRMTLRENLLLPNIKGMILEANIYSNSYDYCNEDFDCLSVWEELANALTPEQKNKILIAQGYEEDDYIFEDELHEWCEEFGIEFWNFLADEGYDKFCSGWGYSMEMGREEDQKDLDYDCYDWNNEVNSEAALEAWVAWALPQVEANLK